MNSRDMVIIVSFLIIAAVLATCGCTSQSSPTATPGPTSTTSATLNGPTATQTPLASAPMISASDPDGYKVWLNYAETPYLDIRVSVGNDSELSTLTTFYTPDGMTQTSRTDDAKYILSTSAKGQVYHFNLGDIVGNVTLIASYNDGASRTLAVLHQAALPGMGGTLSWQPY